MGKCADEFFAHAENWNREHADFKLLTRDSAKKWLNRERWSVQETAYLFCGLEPIDQIPEQVPLGSDPYTERDQEEANGRLRDCELVLKHLYGAISEKEGSGWRVHILKLGDCFSRYRPVGDFYLGDAEFQVRAFYQKAYEISANDALGIDVPCFGIFHSIEFKEDDESSEFRPYYENIPTDFRRVMMDRGILADDSDLVYVDPVDLSEVDPELLSEEERLSQFCEQFRKIDPFKSGTNIPKFVAPKVVIPSETIDTVKGIRSSILKAFEKRPTAAPEAPAAPKVQEVQEAPAAPATPTGAEITLDDELSPGITIRDIQTMLDPNHPRFAPLLALALRVRADLERAPVKENRGLKEQIAERALSLARKARPAGIKGKLTQTAADRIAGILNWKLSGGSPKS